MPTVNDVLRCKGNEIHCIDASATVLGAVRAMNAAKVGAVLVMDKTGVVGIFTERDVMIRVVARELDPRVTAVHEVMSKQVQYASPEMDLDEVAELMKRLRIRHLPVKDAFEQLVGLVSIGDVNAYHVSDSQQKLEHLTQYIHGRG